MKLATIHDGSSDGALVVVSRDLQHVASASAIAATMQQALENWDRVFPALNALYETLNQGKVPSAQPYAQQRFMAPLPRAWQWLDGSAFPQHAKLMSEAFKHPPIETEFPLMYQGLSHLFYGPHDDIPFVSEKDGIDFEGEFGVITSAVPMGTSRDNAGKHIRLVVQLNDWSLRRYAPLEMKTGFGWILAKPACSVAPVAITPDELGVCWQQQRVTAVLQVSRNGKQVGAVPATEMEYGFDDLIAHAARTRPLCTGTLIGSGTVSHSDYSNKGSTCISEQRAIEMIAKGTPDTTFLHFGESVTMRAFAPGSEVPLFGVMDQCVIAAT